MNRHAALAMVAGMSLAGMPPGAGQRSNHNPDPPRYVPHPVHKYKTKVVEPYDGGPPLYDVQAYQAAQREAGKKARKAAKKRRKRG